MKKRLIAKFVGTAREFRESLGERLVQMCKHCDGVGKVMNFSGVRDCIFCNGRGMWVEEVKKLEVKHL